MSLPRVQKINFNTKNERERKVIISRYVRKPNNYITMILYIDLAHNEVRGKGYNVTIDEL